MLSGLLGKEAAVKKTVFNLGALEVKEQPWQKSLGPIVATEWQMNIPGTHSEAGELQNGSSTVRTPPVMFSLDRR